MNFSAADLHAAYDFLKKVAFRKDVKLPSGKSMSFVAKPLANHGYLGKDGDRDCIWIDTTDTRSFDHMLRIMAHEMLHLALDHQDVPNKYAHERDFKEAARVIEMDMGWTRGSV